jgi:hypothetical protein
MSANVDDLGESDFDLAQGDDSDAAKKGDHTDLDTLFGQKKKKADPAPAEGKPDAKLGPFDSMVGNPLDNRQGSIRQDLEGQGHQVEGPFGQRRRSFPKYCPQFAQRQGQARVPAGYNHASED